jgi:hypothetical protein
LSVVTWIPWGNKGDDTEKNGFISPDFVKSFISDKHRLFTVPQRITTNNNKDIVVVDGTSDDTGRVVVVGWEGGLRWTYTGHSKINVTTQFDPSDNNNYVFVIICCDTSW